MEFNFKYSKLIFYESSMNVIFIATIIIIITATTTTIIIIYLD